MIEWWRKDQIIQMTSAQTQSQVEKNINGKCTGKKNIQGTGRVELGGKSEKLVQSITAGLNSERKQEY